ncbi:heart- and neural crest derivatives-expressed protein 2-like [Ornithodoros turicata]|uniref:heart- and neural crest derivatives-expressed protein 2-like n=1 Tax=Ornithodoros turicata TaxID=34597 RepID=UPI00313A3148
MSLVGGFPQAFPPDTLYPYYGAPSAEYLGWLFSTDPGQASELSPSSSSSPAGGAVCTGPEGPWGPQGLMPPHPIPRDPPAPARGGKRRVTANRKERRRTQSINNAFSELRECIPNVPADTKLSKIKTLRLATSYIAYLMDLLEGPPGATQACFKAELHGRGKVLLGPSPGSDSTACGDDLRNKDLAAMMHTMQAEKRGKGRTGWPQHVWALELKHDA